MKKYKFISFFCIVFLGGLSMNVQAEAVYLSCTFISDGKPSVLDFTADEQTAKVSIFVRNSGHSRTVDATFTAEKVMVNEKEVNWIINRTDLVITRNIRMINYESFGKCSIQETPKRAF